jgi:hypothetical protein
VLRPASGGNVPDLIREMFSSNHGQDTNYSDWGLSWPSSAPPRKYRRNALEHAATASFHIPFQFIIVIIIMPHEVNDATDSKPKRSYAILPSTPTRSYFGGNRAT